MVIKSFEHQTVFFSKCGKISFKSNSGYSYYIRYIESPTGNCQIFSIAFFNRVLDVKAEDTKKNLIALFTSICTTLYILKKIMLVDIHRKDAEKFVSDFYDYIISNNPYTSTNGSSMNIILFDTHKFAKDNNINVKK